MRHKYSSDSLHKLHRTKYPNLKHRNIPGAWPLQFSTEIRLARRNLRRVSLLLQNKGLISGIRGCEAAASRFTLYLSLILRVYPNSGSITVPTLLLPRRRRRSLSVVSFCSSNSSPRGVFPRFPRFPPAPISVSIASLVLVPLAERIVHAEPAYRRVFGRARADSSLVYTYLAISFTENVVVLGRTDARAVRSFAGVSPASNSHYIAAE